MSLPYTRHPWRIIAFLLFVAGLVVGSFLLGAQLRPPTQAALDAATTAVRVTARVEARMMSDRQVLKGIVTPGTTIPVVVPAVTGSTRPVVTSVNVSVGENVSSGTLLGSISGQPIVVVKSSVPLYRALKIGDSGPDVLALEREFRSWGYPITPTGKVDVGLLKVYASLFRAAGLAPPTDAPEQATLQTELFVQLPGDRGTVVSASDVGAGVSEQVPLVTVQVSPDTMTARASVSQLERFKVGAPVDLNANGIQFSGTVAQIGEFVTAKDNTEVSGRDISVRVPEQLTGKLAHGSAVTVSSIAAEQSGTAVPLTALRSETERSYVVATSGPGDTDRRVDVKVRSTIDGWAFIEPNPRLEPGTQLVVSP